MNACVVPGPCFAPSVVTRVALVYSNRTIKCRICAERFFPGGLSTWQIRVLPHKMSMNWIREDNLELRPHAAICLVEMFSRSLPGRKFSAICPEVR